MRGLLVLPLVLSACFNPDDLFPVKGTLTSPDPVEGREVRLLREARVDELDLFNLSCSNATPFKETTADGEGHFQFDVFRAQAQRLTGIGQFCFRLETNFSSGSSVFTDILRLNSEVVLPPLLDWRAQPRLENEQLRFEPAAPLPAVESLEGDQLIHRAEFVTADGGLAWVADDRSLDLFNRQPVRVPIVLEPWALEDFTGELRMTSRVRTVEPAEDLPVSRPSSGFTEFELRSGTTLPVAGVRTPVSRGAACPGYGTPCPLTDGALAAVDGGGQTMVTIELDAEHPVSAIVLRGVETPLPLMGVLLRDADGGTSQVQHSLPTSVWYGAMLSPDMMNPNGFSYRFPPAYSTVHLDGGVVKSFTLVFQQGLERISEVSVFE